jgi:hypothetical protein
MKVIAASLLIVCASGSSAQVSEQIGIQRGTRIRLSSASETPLVGSLARATADTVHVLDKDGRLRSIPAREIRAVHVSLGRPVQSARVMKGVLVGTSIIAGAGAVAIAASGDQSGDEGYAWMTIALLAPVGGIIGGIWAARTAPEVWQSVPVSSLSLTPSQLATNGVPTLRPAKGKGKKIAIGALIGGAVGAGLVLTQRRSANPVGTRILLGAVPGILIGGAIGATR